MKHFSGLRAFRAGVFMITLSCCLIGMFTASVLANQTPAGASLVGDAVCLDCHDDVGTAWSKTLHGTVAKMVEGVACESCHGPGSAHIEDADPTMIINPAKSGQFDGTNTCLNCHNTDTFDDWEFSHHNNGDVNCSSCHTVHADTEATTADHMQNKCLACHTDVTASLMMPSRHPIHEGYVTCLDCHNPHGGQADLTQENTTRELCFSCHPEKEGPFVYEHAPANEDCMSCHTPHGSITDNLLIQSEPALCLNCHAMHFHVTVEGVDGYFTPPQAPDDRTSLSTHDAWKTGMLTKCTQCHTPIHGTDLPSQTITTSGNALTR